MVRVAALSLINPDQYITGGIFHWVPSGATDEGLPVVSNGIDNFLFELLLLLLLPVMV